MVAAYLSLFCSISEKPLEYWYKRQSQTGCIRKILDTDLLDNVIEIQDIQQLNISKTSISCPPDITKLLNIELPVLVIILKHFGADCRFQIQVIDTNKLRHHFQFYTGDFDKSRNVKDPVICRAKIQLQSGWNKIELNLKTLTETAFKCHYVATQRLEICANCRLRRIYFLDRHYKDSEISSDLYQGFLDLYMLKWGIHQIDNATQTTTNLKQKKTNVKNNNNKVKQSILNTNNNAANSDDMHCNNKINHSLIQTQSNDCSKLINNIRIKSNSLINEFFKRQNPSSLSIENFKNRTIIKSYVVPTFIKKLQKRDKWDDVNLLNWNNIMEKTKDKSSLPLSSDTQKNHNETFDNLMKQQKDIFKNNIEEKWTYRYLCEGKHYLRTNNTMESNTSDVKNISNQYNTNFLFPLSNRINNNLAKTAIIQRKIKKNRNVKSH